MHLLLSRLLKWSVEVTLWTLIIIIIIIIIQFVKRQNVKRLPDLALY